MDKVYCRGCDALTSVIMVSEIRRYNAVYNGNTETYELTNELRELSYSTVSLKCGNCNRAMTSSTGVEVINNLKGKRHA